MEDSRPEFELDTSSLGQGNINDILTPQASSPLWMITREPVLHELVSYLEIAREKISKNPLGQHNLTFSQTRLREVKAAFAETIRKGEERLHRLCELLCLSLLNSYQIESVVFGEVETSHERFTLMQSISTSALHATTDIDLGNMQLKKLKFFDGQEWSGAQLVANVVEYQPIEPNRSNIYRIISRIKAEEEIWNKVVDEIFNLDSLVRRDKKLWHLSRYIKDVFGLKIVVGVPTDVRKLQQVLQELSWAEPELKQVSVPDIESTRRMSFLEVKDYLGQGERKTSGWEALKSVISWWDRTFEVQIQPLRVFFREREFLTRESHAGFKSRRESVRNQIAQEVPLFAFYRDLLHWLFSEALSDKSQAPVPSFNNVRVVLES